MQTEIQLTPENILAVFNHEAARIRQIELALKDVRPKCSVTAMSFLLRAGTLRVIAKFEPQYCDDGRPKWKAEHEGGDFDALCDQVLADIAAYKADMYGTDVERMALAIIQIKHRDGTVTDRALRMANFTQEAITQIHERAALLANEMSDGKPFEVEFVGAGNHVEAA
jgi:hypothetical protein